MRKKAWTIDRKNVTLTVGLLIVAGMLLIALFAPFLKLHDPLEMNMAEKLIAPCKEYPFGTDHMGRDIWSRIIEGARISLITAVLVVVFSSVLGMIVGMISGFCGGLADMLLMRLVDVMLSFPTMVFILVVSSILGSGQINLIIALCCVQWVRYARVARGEAILLKNAEYVEAAKVAGSSSMIIMVRYFVPAIVSKILVMASLNISSVILYCASLSFLGLGAQPPSPDWGAMINDGRNYMQYAPWMTLFPGLFIAVSAFGFNMIGDGIRDMLDPRMREAVQSE